MSPLERADALRPAGRSLRLVRSVAAALVCVIAAASGHVWAGGTFSAGAAVAVFAGATPVVWLLSVRRITPGQLVGLLALCQVGVHLTASGQEMSMGAGMIAGHVVATAVSAAVLSRGEHFVWHLAERLGLRLAPLLHVPSSPVAGRPAPAVVTPRNLQDACLTYSRSLRGPPVGVA